MVFDLKTPWFMIYLPKTAFPRRHGQKSGFGSVESYAKGPPFWVLTRKVMKFHHFDDIIHLFYNVKERWSCSSFDDYEDESCSSFDVWWRWILFIFWCLNEKSHSLIVPTKINGAFQYWIPRVEHPRKRDPTKKRSIFLEGFDMVPADIDNDAHVIVTSCWHPALRLSAPRLLDHELLMIGIHRKR